MNGDAIMNSTAQLFFKSGILLLLVGLSAGIYMAASHDHAIAGAHAHLNLLGFVVSAVYGTYFALSPAKAEGRLPRVIWGLHTLGALGMFVSLALLLRGNVAMEPLVALSSIIVLLAALMFAYAVFRPSRVAAPIARGPLAAAE